VESDDARLDRLETKMRRVVDALETQGQILARHTELLESLDAHAARTDRRLGAMLKQLRVMNESLIRTMTLRAELDDLRARLARVEARTNGL
jgi:hypothetical protein